MSNTELDMLEKIRKVADAGRSGNEVSREQVRWLIEEIDRARNIEDARTQNQRTSKLECPF